MRFLELLILIVIFKKYPAHHLGQECEYNKNHKWHVVGIYSACYNHPNRTELNYFAEDLDKTVEHMWKMRATNFF